MIPESFIQELLARLDIAEVVERYVPLKKAGSNYKACCPFHSEKTASFNVNPAKQFYHCFGCGASGSAIGFLMQYAGYDFVDAVEELARSIGLSVPRETSPQRVEQAMRAAPLTELMQRAAHFYREQLKQSPRAIDYLKARGLSGDIAKRFGLGYAPDDWQALAHLFNNYDDVALQECGLVTTNEQGRRYDRFRDRIMFPIMDQRGQVIAFGARFIGDHKAEQAANPNIGPKYLNSPETLLFEKGRELYGINQARAGIRAKSHVIVVEGYMDVVALAQHGIDNAVATLGTACTPEHIRKLLRQVDAVVFCFDGDAAGRKAAWRALESSLELLSDDRRMGFMFLPAQHDPDSFVRAEGAVAFQRLAAQPTELAAFLLSGLSAGMDIANSAQDRARLVSTAKPYLQKMAAPVLRLQLIKAVAQAAGMSQAEVEAQCDLAAVTRRHDRQRYAYSRSRPPPRSFTHKLLEIIIRQPAWSARLPLQWVERESFEGAAIHDIADAIDHGELPAGGMGLLLEFVRGKPYGQLVEQMVAMMANNETGEAELEAEFNDAMTRLQERTLQAEISASSVVDSISAREQVRELLARKQRNKTA